MLEEIDELRERIDALERRLLQFYAHAPLTGTSDENGISIFWDGSFGLIPLNLEVAAQITAVSGAYYAWSEVEWFIGGSIDGFWELKPSGRSGTVTSSPAWDLNGSMVIPVGRIVTLITGPYSVATGFTWIIRQNYVIDNFYDVENFYNTANFYQTVNFYSVVNFYNPVQIINPILPLCMPVGWFETKFLCVLGWLDEYHRDITLYMVNGCPVLTAGALYFYAHTGVPCRSPTGTPVTPTPVTCQYTITFSLMWLAGPLPTPPAPTQFYDLDLYVRDETAAVVCYYGNLTAGALTLVSGDCFPACARAPVPPEVIRGTYTAGNEWTVWWNQHSNCTVDIPQEPEQVILVSNTGTANITVTIAGVATVITPGQTQSFFRGANFGYDGYNTGDVHTYTGGLDVVVACGGTVPIGAPTNVQTTCCVATIPLTLYVTLTGVINATYPIVWDGVSAWRGTAACGGNPVTLTFYCIGPGDVFELEIATGPFEQPTSMSDVGSTCSPFVQNFSFVYFLSACGGSVTAVVTS